MHIHDTHGDVVRGDFDQGGGEEIEVTVAYVLSSVSSVSCES